MNHWKKIVEKTGSTVTSTKQFLWVSNRLAEERDGSNNVTRRYFAQGEQRLGGSDAGLYYYSRDHLGSIRELTDAGGTLRARYDYDPFGNRNKLTGNLDVDFAYTGHYYHAASNLYLAPYRAYDPTIGRWISRDPIGEAGGINLYAYVGNDPINWLDPEGLDQTIWTPGPGRSWLDGPRNGAWGGKNWSGGLSPSMYGPPAPPVDSADALYMKHDQAYGNAKCGNDIKTADKTLVDDLRKLPDDPKKWPIPPTRGTERDSASYRDMAIFYFSH